MFMVTVLSLGSSGGHLQNGNDPCCSKQKAKTYGLDECHNVPCQETRCLVELLD